jgi:hypothetical protein
MTRFLYPFALSRLAIVWGRSGSSECAVCGAVWSVRVRTTRVESKSLRPSHSKSLRPAHSLTHCLSHTVSHSHIVTVSQSLSPSHSLTLHPILTLTSHPVSPTVYRGISPPPLPRSPPLLPLPTINTPVQIPGQREKHGASHPSSQTQPCNPPSLLPLSLSLARRSRARSRRFRNLFPGFGIAVVAFSAYVVYDNLSHPAHVSSEEEEGKGHQVTGVKH